MLQRFSCISFLFKPVCLFIRPSNKYCYAFFRGFNQMWTLKCGEGFSMASDIWNILNYEGLKWMYMFFEIDGQKVI